ncbi:MAG: hypothetical protein GX556_01360 [Fibrobacter sp.]|nr:hypothetical protein [Fibrobacter sp.]
MNDTSKQKLDQKQANGLARLFNILYNSAFLYGGTHPTTRKNTALFFDSLENELLILPLISLIIDRESLYIEEWCVDKVINTKRIVSQFTKSAIVSVSFSQGIRIEEIEEFISLAGDSKGNRTAAEIEQVLLSKGINNLRLNYIRIGKITADQAIVRASEAPESKTSADEHVPVKTSLSKDALKEIEHVLSMAKLLEHPEKAAALLSEAACNPETSTGALNSISSLRNEIKTSSPGSLDVLLDAVYELKIDLAETIEIQKTTGKILSAADPVRKQINELTCDILLKLVKEEYQNGALPTKRLAQIIRRMLPDISELKEILPRLKETLIKEGMPLSDYLELIRALDLELEGEAIAGSLKDAAESIGVTIGDIVSAIKSEPGDSAKLIYLASEIRCGTGTDEMQLSNLLTDYIEKISVEMAADSREVTLPQGSKVLRKILGQLESELVDKIKKTGVEESVLLKVKQQLSSRFESAFDDAAVRYISSNGDSGKDESPEEISKKLLNFLDQQDQLSRFQKPLLEALQTRGLNAEKIEQLLKQISHPSSELKQALPPGTLFSNNMRFLLDREMRQHQRYKTPFSTIMISAKRILSADSHRIPQKSEICKIVPPLFSAAKELLRDIDLIGFTHEPDFGVIFVLLAMTGREGALIVKERLRKRIGELKVVIENQEFSIEPVVSVTTPVENTNVDLKTYLELAVKTHREEISTIGEK